VEIKAFGLTIDTDTVTDKQKMITGAVVGLLLVGFAFYYNKPTYDTYQELLTEIDRLTTDKLGKEAQVAKLPALKLEYEQLQANIRRLEAQIPRTENVPTLLVDMERLTGNHEVFLQTFVPGALAQVNLPPAVVGDGKATANLQNQLRQLPVKISATGSYPNLIDMYAAFERYERTLAADSISIAPVGKAVGGKKQLQVSFNLNAYVLLGGANGNP
jgi:Tfp pilus assembly protein PilO